MKLEKYNKLKANADGSKTRHQRAVGVFQSLKKELRKKHGIKSVKEAAKLHEELSSQERKAELAFDKEVENFCKKYEDVLSK